MVPKLRITCNLPPLHRQLRRESLLTSITTILAKTFRTLCIFSIKTAIYFTPPPPPLDNAGRQESNMGHKSSTVKGRLRGVQEIAL